MSAELDEAIADVEGRIRAGDGPGALALARALRDPTSPARDVWADLLEATALVTDEGNARAARPLADRAVLGARQLGDGLLEAMALRAVARVQAVAGDLDGAARALRDAAPRVRDRLRLAEIQADQALVASRAGALGEAEERIADATRGFDASGDKLRAAEALVLGASLRRRQGDPAGAREVLAAASRRLSTAADADEQVAVAVWAEEAELALAGGDGAEALRLVRRALGRLGPGRAQRRSELWCTVGEAHRALGDPDAAAAAYRRAGEILDEAGLDALTPRSREVVLLVARGRFEDARVRLGPLFERVGSSHRLAVLHALMLPCAVHARDWTAWAHHWRRAVSLAGASGLLGVEAADAARQAGEMCGAIPDGGPDLLSRAARAHALSLELYRRLDHEDAAVAEARALHELGARGAPIPAGPFDLVRRIGRGAMGEVWRGRHHERRLVVAIKVVAPGHVGDARFRALIDAELRAVAALDHPNVVRVLGAGLLGPEAEAVAHGAVRVESPWFAMQIADGGTLDALCGRLSWSGARAVLLSLLDALAHAHARGVVHLDLKPSNVLLRRLADGHRGVLLTDFGLSHVLARAGVRTSLAGTPQYMAPEQFRGDVREYGPWTDLYALGCLAVHLVQGSPPFAGATLEAQRRAHLEDEPPPVELRGAPPGLRDWLARLLAKAPRDRWQRAADAAWALRRLPDGASDAPAAEPGTAAVFGSTWVFSMESEDDPGPPTAAGSAAEGGRRGDRPPLPQDWRPVAPPRADAGFVDAALSLFDLRQPPFVGREAERDRLWTALRAVSFAGAPRAVRLEGARGSGKTLLARWLCERAHELGAATVLDGGLGPDGQHGLRAMVGRHLRLEGLSSDQAEARVRQLLPDLDPSVASDLAVLVVEHGVALSGGERVGAVAALATAIAAIRPVVVRLEASAPPDPDAPLLARVLSRVPAPVLLLVEGIDDGLEDPPPSPGPASLAGSAPIRPPSAGARGFGASMAGSDENGESRAPNPRAVSGVDGRKGATLAGPSSVVLGPMADDQVGALLDALVPLTATLRARLVELAGGNPDLAVRTLSALVRRDALAAGESGHDLRRGVTLGLPEDLAATWGERLAAVLGALPPAERTVLTAAALLGPALDRARLDALATAGGVATDGVVAAAAGLLRADGTFEHPALPTLLREVWADLPAAQLAATALEDVPVPAAVRAPLLLRAGRLREAAGPLLEGALAALAAGDTGRAAEWVERRASILDGLGREPDAPDQVPDMLLRARIAVATGRADAGEITRRAVDLSERHGPQGALGEALLVRAAWLRERGAADPARVELKRAIDAFDAAADPAGAARALRAAGDLSRSAGDLDGAGALYRRALARLGGGDEPAVRAALRAALGAVVLARGEPAVAEAELAEAFALAEEHGGDDVAAEILTAMGDVSRATGDLATADARYRSALARVPWHDARRVRTIALRRALVLVAAGRFGEASGALDTLLAGADPSERSPFVAWCRLAQLALVARADDGTWKGHLQLVETLLRGSELREPDAAWLLEVAGRRAADLGRPERAVPAWQLAAQVWRAIGRVAEADRVARLVVAVH